MIPNCVPDYYLERFEREEHEWELMEERMDWYRKAEEYRESKRKEGCAIFAFPPDECYSCEHGEEAPPTSSEDDIPGMICPNWRTCKVFRQKMETSFPDTKWSEIVTWFAN